MVFRGSSRRAKATVPGTSRSRSDRMATAPWASALGTKSAPSRSSPFRATKAQPGPASRLSHVIWVTATSPKGTRYGPCTPAFVIHSVKFMAPSD